MIRRPRRVGDSEIGCTKLPRLHDPAKARDLPLCTKPLEACALFCLCSPLRSIPSCRAARCVGLHALARSDSQPPSLVRDANEWRICKGSAGESGACARRVNKLKVCSEIDVGIDGEPSAGPKGGLRVS